jgi:hypothetical protein
MRLCLIPCVCRCSASTACESGMSLRRLSNPASVQPLLEPVKEDHSPPPTPTNAPPLDLEVGRVVKPTKPAVLAPPPTPPSRLGSGGGSIKQIDPR